MSSLEIKRWNQAHSDFVADPYKSVWDIQVDAEREARKNFMGKAFCVTPHNAAVAKREVEMQKTFIVGARSCDWRARPRFPLLIHPNHPASTSK